MKEEREISDKRDEASDASNRPVPKYPGMTYEQGVRDALDWVLGDYDGDLEL